MRLHKSYLEKGNAPYPFTKEYVALAEKKGNQVFLIEEDDVIIPLEVKKKFVFKIGQILYPPLQNASRLKPENERLWLNKLMLFIRKEKVCDGLIPPLHIAIFNAYPKGSWVTKIGLIVLNFSESSIEEIFSKFNSKNRTQIRKAIREGVLIEEGIAGFEDFYNLYSENLSSQNLPYDSKEHILDFLNALGEDNYFILKASYNGIVEGVVIIVASNTEAYYYYGSSQSRTQLKGSNKLLQYEVLKKLLSRKIFRYSFGGARLHNIENSKFEGIQSYKLSFGSKIEEGFHFKYTFNVKYKIYLLLLKYYLKMKGISENKGLNYEKK